MNKLKIFLLSFVLSSSAWANPPIMFTQPSGRGTGNDMWVEMTRAGLESAGLPHRYEVGTCATSIQAWDNAGTREPALMLYSSNWTRTALQTGQPCLVKDLDRITVYAVVKTPWWVCKNKTKSRAFDAPGVTVGYHEPSTPGQDIFDDINKTNNWSWKGISTKGSGANLMMLINGELDYGFMASPFARRKILDDPSSPLQCVASWKKNDVIPYFKDIVKMQGDPSGLLYYTQIIIGKNLTPDQDKKIRSIFDAKQNPKFQDWVNAQASQSDVPSDSQQFMNNFIQDVKKVMSTYQK